MYNYDTVKLEIVLTDLVSDPRPQSSNESPHTNGVTSMLAKLFDEKKFRVGHVSFQYNECKVILESDGRFHY